MRMSSTNTTPAGKQPASATGWRPGNPAGTPTLALDGNGVFLNASPCGPAAGLAVPLWLRDIASPWVLARRNALPFISALDGS
jgi:hypothetical protein